MFSSQIQVLLWAMAPISEVRGAIPIGVSLDLPLWEVFLISFIGNLIPVFFLLAFLGRISDFLSKKNDFLKKFFDWLFKRTRKKFRPLVEKYGKQALILFVAIPLPITGAWTGSIAAFLFGIPLRAAVPLIAVGISIAGGIVFALTSGGVVIEKYFGYESLILALAMVFALYFFYKLIRRLKMSKL